MNYTIEFEIDSELPIYGIYTINNKEVHSITWTFNYIIGELMFLINKS